MAKKITAALLALCMACTAFAGCGKSVDNSTSDNSSDSDANANEASFEVTAEVNTFYTAKELGELAKKDVEGFTFKYPDNDTEKQFKELGVISQEIIVLDADGKQSSWELKLSVTDTQSPTFSGIKDLKIKAGDKIDLKQGVKVNDNFDKNLDFTVTFDADDKDTSAPGEHNITYTARDSSGNVASRKALLTITGDGAVTASTEASSVPDDSSSSKDESSTQATTKAAPADGKSENVKFYQDRIVIAGDSIAYGFCAYGYIPYERNIAKGSTALRQYDDTSLFTFDPTGTALSFVDAIGAVKPSLLYISMGMNDVNLIDDAKYIERYKDLIAKVKQKVPDAIIVTASITPITQGCTFTDINTIRKFNEELKKMTEGMNDPNVVFFDAYAAIAGPDGMYTAAENAAQDGIHLAGPCYQTLLEKLAVTLDQYGMKDKITKIEADRK